MRRALLCLLWLGLCTCASTDRSWPRLPRQAPGEAEKLRAGDTLHLQIFDDDGEWIRTAVPLGADGAATVPYCGRLVLAGGGARDVEDRVERCLMDAGLYVDVPHAYLQVDRGVSVRVHGNSKHGTGDSRVHELAAEPGLTIVSLLLRVLRGAEGYPDQIELLRSGTRYRIDMDAILRGDHENEPIEPGDEIFLDQELLSAPAPDAPRPSTEFLRTPRASKESCGELMLHDARLAGRFGQRHPDLIAVREALARCPTDGSSASLREACIHLIRQRTDLMIRGVGPAHPDLRRLDQARAICPPP